MDELLIALFAFIGGSLRLMISQLVPTFNFPVATLGINLIGSFVLAWLTGMVGRSHHLPPRLNLALGTGMVGAFTTFSTLTLDMYHLLLNHHWWLAAGYVLLSLVGGTLMAWLGLWFNQPKREVKRDE